MKELKKKIFGIFLITITLVNFIPFTNVNAQILQDTLYQDDNYKFWVAIYNRAGTKMVKTQESMIRRQSDNAPVYCIQPHIQFNSGSGVTGVIDSNAMLSMTNMLAEQIERIKLIAYYGYGYGNHTSAEWYYATQLLIWSITNPGYAYAIADNDASLTPSSRYDAYYNELNSLVANHTTQPSFYGKKVEMIAGETVTLQDTNQVLSKYYEGISNSNISAKIDGNNLIITAKTGYEGEIKLFTKKNPNPPTLYEGANQYCMSAGDPVAGLVYLDIFAKVRFTGTKYYGSNKDGIYKYEKDAEFELYNYNTNKLITTLKSNDDGIITYDFGFGKYRLHQIKGKEGYDFISDYKFTIDNTKTKEVAIFKNELITSDLEFTKTDFSTGELLPNTLIEIYNADTDELIFSGRTDENGSISIKNISFGKYYILEKEAPDGYELNNEKMYFEVTTSGKIIKCNMKDHKIIKVPDTLTHDYHLIEITSGLIFLIGLGVVIYGIKRKNKDK